jgi:alanine racemase
VCVLPKELQRIAEELSAAGAKIGITGITASPQLLRTKDYKVGIVHVGAALYGQQEIVPGTRPAARWLTRILTLKKVTRVNPCHTLGSLRCD